MSRSPIIALFAWCLGHTYPGPSSKNEVYILEASRLKIY